MIWIIIISAVVLLILITLLIFLLMVNIKLHYLLDVRDISYKFVEVYIRGREKPYFGYLRQNELNIASRIDNNDWYVTIRGAYDTNIMVYKGDIISIEVINSVPTILKKGWNLIGKIQR